LRVAAETKLKGEMRHMRADLAAGHDGARAYGLVGAMPVQPWYSFSQTYCFR
jgi:hypothetical protein